MAANDAGNRDSGKAARKVDEKEIDDEPTRVEPESVRKAREDLFREASELSRLTGAQVGIIAYSSSGQPQAFGTTPSADTIFQRFAGQYAGVVTGGSSSGFRQEDEVEDPVLAIKECLEEELDDLQTVEELESYIENLNRMRAMVAQRMAQLDNQRRDVDGGSASQPEMSQQRNSGQGKQQSGWTGDEK